MNKFFQKYVSVINEMKTANDSNTIISLKEKADILFEQYIKNIKKNEYITELKNNTEKYSFGEIKAMFENIIPQLFNSKAGKTIVKEYVKLIKEDKELQNIYILHESIINPKTVDDAKLFVTESFQLVGNIKPKMLNEQTNKLVNILVKGIKRINLNEDKIELDEVTKQLNTSINYLATNTKSIKNLTEHTNKINFVADYVEKHQAKDVTCVDIDELAQQMFESYGDKLTMNECEMLKTIINPESQKEIFENHKIECLNMLSEAIKTSEGALNIRLNELKEKIEIKEFNKDTALTDIANFVDFKKTLKE